MLKSKRKPTKPRPIRAHKGGRTQRIQGRLTPEEYALVWKALKLREMTFSDWVVEKAKQDAARAG